MQKVSSNLLERFQEGSEEAFNELYQYYKGPAVRFCNSILKDIDESENIIQEVFIKIWDRKHAINLELNFTSYLFTIIKNRIFDYLKEIKKKESLKEKYWKHIVEHAQSDKELQEERIIKIQDAIEDLSEKRKKIIKLNYEEGKSYEEIANELNISINTVKNQLVKAKQVIRRRLGIASIF